MNRLSLFFKENMEIGVPTYLQMRDTDLDENEGTSNSGEDGLATSNKWNINTVCFICNLTTSLR
jgi:hypothetical protein